MHAGHRKSLWPRRAALCLGAALLSACAQPLVRAPDGCRPASTDSVRLLLSFHQPVDGAAPATLAQLQNHSQACVRHVASVSPTVHAYVFSGVSDASVLRQRLLAWPLVRDAVPDARLPAH